MALVQSTGPDGLPAGLGQPIIHMRGIGSNDDGAALDNSIIVYLDDVYVSRISAIDINLLTSSAWKYYAALRAPSMVAIPLAGQLMWSVKSPSSEATVDINTTLGNFDHRAMSAVFNGPCNTTNYCSGWH